MSSIPPEINREMRGHTFYPTEADSIPPLYAQDSKGKDAIAYVHYFGPALDAYVTEYDPKTGEAFGWVMLNNDLPNAELGYIDLPAYESYSYKAIWPFAERDLHFDPKPLRECIAEVERRFGA
ncbi:hypothetical protein [Streptomyces halobius]|uniref:Uncharacterized protein n=1 Tax=Streptomyces halobius TaxID=2879846 RepID=A0ABY4M5M1_9ACTN|nr:hypothetical protein [Streptomyces halobius]UQA91660.1 hypothetical protein K9S39_07095 [Streptomyces halobius]